MKLDRDQIGRTFPPGAPYQVGREKIREYAEAIGDPYPAYRDPAAARALGHPDVIAPPTFVIVLTYAANLPILDEYGIALRHLVHGNQRFAYARPIHAGDRLSCTVTIDNVTTLAGAEFLTTRADVRDAGDAQVVTAWCTLVIRDP
ncbi:MAG: FAS1-like dehydratase domain-containing protein [Micromonosporaceae bacterium]